MFKAILNCYTVSLFPKQKTTVQVLRVQYMKKSDNKSSYVQ